MSEIDGGGDGRGPTWTRPTKPRDRPWWQRGTGRPRWSRPRGRARARSWGRARGRMSPPSSRGPRGNPLPSWTWQSRASWQKRGETNTSWFYTFPLDNLKISLLFMKNIAVCRVFDEYKFRLESDPISLIIIHAFLHMERSTRSMFYKGHLYKEHCQKNFSWLRCGFYLLNKLHNLEH